jgi:hypothetical protein
MLKDPIRLTDLIKEYEYDKKYELFKKFPKVKYENLIVDILNGGRHNNKLLYLDISSKNIHYSYDYYTNNWEKN